jgi:hypothetical protein
MAVRLAGFVLMALAISTACRAASQDEYANIHSVAIISRVGDTMTLQNVGTTIVTNSLAQLPIADWNIDEAIESQAADLLSPRFAVKPIDTSKLAPGQSLSDFVKTLPPQDGIDAYVLIEKDVRTGILGHTAETYEGLGLFRLGLIFSYDYEVFAAYIVHVVDARTGKEIDYGRAALNDGGLLGDEAAMSKSNAANWAETADALTDAQKQALRTELEQLVRDSLPHALKRTHLLD